MFIPFKSDAESGLLTFREAVLGVRCACQEPAGTVLSCLELTRTVLFEPA